MTPRSEEAFEKIRSASRGRIIIAALDLFALNGYGQTSIEAIAKKAGVAKGLIYNYFSNKEELLYEAFLSSFGDMEASVESMFSSDQNPVTLIEQFIDGLFDMFSQQIDMWRLQISIFLNPGIPERVREIILQKLYDYSLLIKQIFTGCGIKDAESEAFVFAASLDGIMLYYLLYGNRLPLEGCRKVIKRKYRTLIEQSCGKDKE